MGTIVNFLRTFGFYRSSSTVVPIIATLLLSGVVFLWVMIEVYSFRENHGAVKKQGLLRVPTTKWVPRPAMTTPDLTILNVGSMRDSKHVAEA
jgi:hypothetical protein